MVRSLADRAFQLSAGPLRGEAVRLEGGPVAGAVAAGVRHLDQVPFPAALVTLAVYDIHVLQKVKSETYQPNVPAKYTGLRHLPGISPKSGKIP